MGMCKIMAGGGTSGRCVWLRNKIVKPKQYVTNPQLSCTYGENNHVRTGTIHSVGYDVTQIPDLAQFLNGFESTGGRFYIENGQLYLCGVGMGSGDFNRTINISNIQAAAADTIEFYGNGAWFYLSSCTYSYTGKKLIANEVLEPTIYVINNNINKYPIDGEHSDGFYYQLLAQTDSTNIATLSTFTYDAARNAAIQEVQNELNR